MIRKRENNSTKILIIKPVYEAWPVGYAYVLACFEQNGIPFDFIDSSLSHSWEIDVVAKLKQNQYYMVAMGGLIGFYKVFKTVAELTRKYNPGTPFILGGNIVKDANDVLLFKEIGIDFGFVGEAETSIPQFMKAFSSGNKDFSEVPGLVYRDINGRIIRNSQKRLDLKQNNVLPAWHYFDIDYYIKKSSASFVGDNLCFMPILSGRGCVGQCGFCSPSIGGFRKRKIEDVISEIEGLISNYDFKYLSFYNEMFYPTCAEIKEFCKCYKSIKNRKPWVTGVRIDANIDVETFIEMKEAGCIVVSAGIESGSDRILKNMKKDITADQIRIFCRNARQAKMPINGTFIVGYEGETEEDLKATIDLVIDEEINSGASLLYIYPGTSLYANALRKGVIKDEIEFLKKSMMSFENALFSPEGKEEYYNVSQIPDKDFFKIVISEVRRYYTFLFTRYPVNKLSFQIEIKNTKAVISMTGNCHECNTFVSYEYGIFKGRQYSGSLGEGINDRLVCQNCFTRLSFDIYKCNNHWKLPNHFDSLKEQMIGKNRIIIAGINQDLNFLLRINLFNINYDKILGIISVDNNYKGSTYLNYPVLNTDEAVDLKPDLVIWLDIFNDTRYILKKFKEKNISPPSIVFLIGEQMKVRLKDLRHEETREIMTNFFNLRFFNYSYYSERIKCYGLLGFILFVFERFSRALKIKKSRCL